MNVFITADTHFGHENIIKYCDRPFSSVEEMDKQLIKNWNSVVSNEDLVIHLGDLSWGNKHYTENILKKLNGRKMLIKGNHDCFSDNWYREHGFEYVSRYPILYNNWFWLSHAPLEFSFKAPGPYFNCYGHVHNNPQYVTTENSICFSVERTCYFPVLCFVTSEEGELIAVPTAFQ